MYGATTFDRHANEYDRWFDSNELVFQAEVKALKNLIPQNSFGLEAGVGTGRFAYPFGIDIGIDPSWNMLQIARTRDISVCQALGENLPFKTNLFDFVLLVTVVCFVNNVLNLLNEVKRVIINDGYIIIGFIDRNTPLGHVYESRKNSDKFYQSAFFYSAPEMIRLVNQSGFTLIQCNQAIFGLSGKIERICRFTMVMAKGLL